MALSGGARADEEKAPRSALNGKAARTVLFLTAAAAGTKVLGLCRSLLFSAFFGAGEEAAAFTAALRIPLTVFDLLLAAAAANCLIPTYCRAKSREDADRFASGFFWTVLLVCALLAACGAALAPALIRLTAPGMTGSGKQLAVTLLRILFPMIVFTGGAAVLSALHQARGSFLLPASVSLLSNLILIAGLLVLRGRRIRLLALLFVIAWGVQFLTVAFPFFKKVRAPSLLPKEDAKDVLRTALPSAVGAWLLPAAALIGSRYGTLADPSGNVRFDRACLIFTLTGGLLVSGLSAFLFPKLSEAGKSGGAGVTGRGLIAALALTVPSAVLLTCLSGEITSVLFRHGAYSAPDAAATAETLSRMAPFLPAYAAVELIGKAFFAAGKPRVPMIASLTGIAADLFLSAFVRAPGLLGLAYGLGIAAAAAVLTVFLFSDEALSPAAAPFFAAAGTVLLSAALLSPLSVLLHSRFGVIPENAGVIRNLLTCTVVLLSWIPYPLLLAAAYRTADKIRKKRGERG